MAYDYHALFGVVSVLLGLVGYGFYFRSIFRGETKPHLFTWLIYAILDVIVFAAQVLNGAGPGAWVTLTGIIGTSGVALASFRYGERHITKSDWTSFIAALSAIILWLLTNNALTAVIIAAVINFLAMWPTFRKAYWKPGEESTSIWLVDSIRYSVALAALASFTLTTAMFPAALVFGDVLLIVMILIRRRQLNVDR